MFVSHTDKHTHTQIYYVIAVFLFKCDITGVSMLMTITTTVRETCMAVMVLSTDVVCR